MLNHQITESRAKATAEMAKKVEANIKEKVDKFQEIKEEYDAKLNEINGGFVDHLQAIQEQERRKVKPPPKLLSTEARAIRRRKAK